MPSPDNQKIIESQENNEVRLVENPNSTLWSFQSKSHTVSAIAFFLM